MFSVTMGVAPHRYVSRQRLESAKMMLADGKRSLRDIAVSCQFSSQTSFNRAFLRAIGVTPGEYRRARVEERYLALRPDWVRVQQVHRRSEEAIQNLAQEATSIPEIVVAALSVTEASPALLWSSPPDGATDYLNAAWLAHFGLSRGQAQGKGWQSLIHHDDHKVQLDAWLASVKTGNPFSVVSRMRCRDGQYHRILHTANPVRDAFGRIVRWSGTNLDLDNVVAANTETVALERVKREN